MTYLRLPNARLPGRALKQTPQPNGNAGALGVTLDVDVATTTGLGVVQVGAGLSITTDGVLSTNNNSGNQCSTTYVNRDYAIQPDDYYIGVIKGEDKTVDIVLPLPTSECRILVIKDQRGPGDYKVELFPQMGSTLEGSTNKLKLQQPYESVTLLGQGSAWWIISRVQQ